MKRILKRKLKSIFSIDLEEESLIQCVGSQNDTHFDCPVHDHQDKSEFLAIVQN